MRTLSLVKAEKACVDVLGGDVYYTCSVPSYLQTKLSYLQTKLSDAVVSLSKVGTSLSQECVQKELRSQDGV